MGKLKNRFTIQVYNIGIVSRNIIENGIKSNSIKWLKHNYKDRFFADPFLWYQDIEYYYILAEEMCFFLEYGRIVLLKVKKNEFELESRELIIEEPFHLSFPYCKINGDFIIPEAGISGKSTCYKVSIDTHKIIDKIIISDEGIIDPVLVENHKESIIFGSRISNPSGALYAYAKTSLGKYELISDKPLYEGKNNARNAGDFFEYNGEIIRPAQDCTKRYGCATALMKIKNISVENYEEEEIQRFTSEGNPPYEETLHTFNVYEDIVIVDGSIDVYAFRNYVYRARKLIRRIISKIFSK